MEILRGRRSQKPKWKGKYEAKLEIPGGVGGQTKKPSMGEVWIFSGPTH